MTGEAVVIEAVVGAKFNKVSNPSFTYNKSYRNIDIQVCNLQSSIGSSYTLGKDLDQAMKVVDKHFFKKFQTDCN